VQQVWEIARIFNRNQLLSKKI